MRLYILILVLMSSLAYAAPETPIDKINDSNQLLLVRAANWESVKAELQLYQRDTKTHQWVAVGSIIQVVVGKKGMGWGVSFQPNSLNEPQKQEGDSKAPAGVFDIGNVFGFASKKDPHYLTLEENTFCADDIDSTYYNQIINTADVTKDWKDKTGEYMRTQPLYKIGAIVNYNGLDIKSKDAFINKTTSNIVKTRGSCIFMHIWRPEHTGTAGCIAMERSDLEQVLKWLDYKQKPLIALFPQPVYDRLKQKWELPIK